MKKISYGFTMAECMLVMLIVGVAFAILTPVLFATAPDQELLRARKAYHTLLSSVSLMVNSSSYAQSQGSLDMTPYLHTETGTAADLQNIRDRYFCANFAETVNTKFVDCSLDIVNDAVETSGDTTCSNNFNFAFSSQNARNTLCLESDNGRNGMRELLYEELMEQLDVSCENFYTKNADTNPSALYNFQTNDGVYWGIQLTNFSHDAAIDQYGVSIPSFYNLICINTDFHQSAEHTYGAGVNKDGNILLGKKLSDLVETEESSIQGN